MLRKATDALIKQDPDFQELVDKLLSGPAGPIDAAIFADDVWGRRWPEAEDFITIDPEAASYYATEVVGGRWPKGERAIAHDAEASYNYAHMALEDRFPAGEPAIAKNGDIAYLYATKMLSDPWPEAEAAIAAGRHAEAYAREFLGIEDKSTIDAWKENPEGWSAAVIAANKIASEAEKQIRAFRGSLGPLIGNTVTKQLIVRLLGGLGMAEEFDA